MNYFELENLSLSADAAIDNYQTEVLDLFYNICTKFITYLEMTGGKEQFFKKITPNRNEDFKPDSNGWLTAEIELIFKKTIEKNIEKKLKLKIFMKKIETEWLIKFREEGKEHTTNNPPEQKQLILIFDEFTNYMGDYYKNKYNNYFIGK